jgi:hypothetical protein
LVLLALLEIILLLLLKLKLLRRRPRSWINCGSRDTRR